MLRRPGHRLHSRWEHLSITRRSVNHGVLAFQKYLQDLGLAEELVLRLQALERQVGESISRMLAPCTRSGSECCQVHPGCTGKASLLDLRG